MISKPQETVEFIKDLEERTASNHEPAWLKESRLKNFERFNQLGIPTIKNEDWKYTNLSTLTKERFSFASQQDFAANEQFKKYTDGDEVRIVFVNGYFSSELSSVSQLPKGLDVRSFKEALKSSEPLVQKLLKKFESSDEKKAFVALNKYCMQDGYFIHVADKVSCTKLIHIIFVTANNQRNTATFVRNLIVLEKSSEASVLETHVSFDEKDVYFNNPLTEIYVSENAHLHYCKAQKESAKAFHIATARVIQERNSTFNGFNLSCGGQITRNDLDIALNGEGSSAILNGFYTVSEAQLVDNHTFVSHNEPNCFSNQLYKGILNDSSRGVFNGKIYVDPKAQKTNSYQLNKNLLLGKNASIDTKPQLEIFADDVKCTHGATIGQFNEEEIFYLRSRCVSKREATKMLAVGFVEDVLEHITDRKVIDKLHVLLEPSLAAL